MFRRMTVFVALGAIISLTSGCRKYEEDQKSVIATVYHKSKHRHNRRLWVRYGSIEGRIRVNYSEYYSTNIGDSVAVTLVERTYEDGEKEFYITR